MSCCVKNIRTADKYQNQGLATLALRQFVKLVFDKTNADLLVASVTADRIPSVKTFERVGFSHVRVVNCEDGRDKFNMSLDGGKLFFRPSFYPGSNGNYYFSRYDYEKRRKQMMLEALKKNAVQIVEFVCKN
jgi:hypothetical protein